jgi:hypothetical protein
VARVALSTGELARTRQQARRELGQLERIVVAGGAQAQWIVVGVKVWHVREPPYRPGKKSARRIAADSSKRL